MRLWSISPSYLDRKGLVALWSEALLAQKVLLQGEYKECSECNGFGYDLLYDKDGEVEDELICSKCNYTGKIKTPYYNHPQLERFKNRELGYIATYLQWIYLEGKRRGYNFDVTKIYNGKFCINNKPKITVTTGQLEYEFNLLQGKLIKNNRDMSQFHINWNMVNFDEIETDFEKKKTHTYKILDRYSSKRKKVKSKIKSHPLFKVIKGDIESWEKVK